MQQAYAVCPCGRNGDPGHPAEGWCDEKLDQVGPDGVTERWKQTFLPVEMRRWAAEILVAHGQVKRAGEGD